jgi:hypothetical protein
MALDQDDPLNHRFRVVQQIYQFKPGDTSEQILRLIDKCKRALRWVIPRKKLLIRFLHADEDIVANKYPIPRGKGLDTDAGSTVKPTLGMGNQLVPDNVSPDPLVLHLGCHDSGSPI